MLNQNIALFPSVFQFRKTPNFDVFFNTAKLKDLLTNFSGIRCPLCEWQPKASSRWCCSDFGSHFGCGTTWNTFDTRGVCPGCDYQWKWTDCLRCFRASPHDDWYKNE